MCFLKRQRAHCFVLFEYGIGKFGIFFTSILIKVLNSFLLQMQFPQFDDFMFSRCAMNLTVWFGILNLKALFVSLTYVSCLLLFSFSDSFIVHNITFDLISNTFKPCTKLGNPPQSVNRVDKPVIIQTLNAVYIIVFNPQRYHTKKA